MATATPITTAPKIDRSAIMRAAWVQVKRWYSARNRRFVFDKGEFQWALQCAWHSARMELLTATERRIVAIESEIERLSYKPIGINIAVRKEALQAELRTFVAA